jgi:L-erythro-3,5-diaminohexanoate dehydrogenase
MVYSLPSSTADQGAATPQISQVIDLATRLGVDRVIAPRGAAPQAADRLDITRPPGEAEVLLEVELLNLDATSHRQIREACESDAARIADTIAAIVAARGKMHNPVTGSGGILVGRVAEIGAVYPAERLAPGDRIVPLASLSLIPLALDGVGPVDVDSPQIPVRGRAILPPIVPCSRVPEDLPLAVVVSALDVYGAASHTRALASPGARVTVLGGGRAGLLAGAAACEATGTPGSVTVVDVRDDALKNVRAALPGVRTVWADAADPLATHAALRDAGADDADLTILVVNQPRCELAAVLATAPDGRVVLFSMAASLTAAALGAEGVASTARLLVGNGFAPDRGSYALDLLRRDERLRGQFARLA